jgi:hypothetical protein
MVVFLVDEALPPLHPAPARIFFRRNAALFGLTRSCVRIIAWAT